MDIGNATRCFASRSVVVFDCSGNRVLSWFGRRLSRCTAGETYRPGTVTPALVSLPGPDFYRVIDFRADVFRARFHRGSFLDVLRFAQTFRELLELCFVVRSSWSV